MTAADLIRQALRSIEYLGQSQPLRAEDGVAALEALNAMLDTWRLQRQPVYQLTSVPYLLTPNRGGVADPYTIGPGGDFNQVRPLWIPRATLTDVDTGLATELEILTDDAWSDIAAGVVSDQRATGLYYRTAVPDASPQAGTGRAFVLLYPVPMSLGITLRLTIYTPVPLVRFADLVTTDYDFPPGTAEALRYQLALRLASEFGKTVSPQLQTQATAALGNLAPPLPRLPLLRGALLASTLIAKAYRSILVLRPGDVLTPAQAQVGFEALNDLLDAWAAIRLTIFQTTRLVYPLIAGKGTPDNPYTIGPGGDFDQARPLWIPNARILIHTTDPPFEAPCAVYTNDQWASLGIKTLASALVQGIYYDTTFPSSGASLGLGTIMVYPIPTGALPLSLVLYTPIPLTTFADLNTTPYSFPPGYAEALRYQLALRLASEAGVPVPPIVAEMATVTFAVVQRPNVRMPALRTDVPVGRGALGLYNWRLGEGG